MNAVPPATAPAREAEEPIPASPAWHKVGRALGDVAGRIVEKVRWARGHVFNPKILQVDVKTPNRTIKPPANWAQDVINHFRYARVVNEDISTPYFTSFVLGIEKVASDGRGFVQRGFKALGGLGDQGKENARKAIRWLEDHGWIGTLNTLYRDEETRELRRGENVYLLFGKEDAAEITAIGDASARALKRESLTLSRGAVLWQLMVRPWGLNATPSPSNRHQTRTRAAPA
jgi:hypothetical protein